MPSHAYTQIPGHGLQAEGKPYTDEGHGWVRVLVGDGVGLCSCGATSEALASDAARKRWHQGHKRDVIASVTGMR
jgi:hypothetical protein